ncbi:MAG TPA: UDP-N-acetylmuramate dehydrogenase [Candidatus Paceibacterota bacterium]|nr:UDP-N-acetylmuramate dehydrogenase [Candidatus Paceibacterota bacterium]
MNIQEHAALAPLTTFGIGGPAAYLVRAGTTEEIAEALQFAQEHRLKVFILGGGSNTLFPDNGFDGLVIKIENTGITQEGDVVIAEAGESWDRVVEYAVQHGLWGIENLSGIPGTVGGAVVQNIGAYGAALSQTLTWVEVYDTHAKEVTQLTASDCAFGYRDSIFKQKDGKYIVLRAALKLSSTAAPDLSYRDLNQRFKNATPELAEIRSAVIEIRNNKFPDLAREGTAGSFFKNPVLPLAQAQALREQYPDMPLFDLPESSGVKVPLGWILDHVLKVRGLRIGSARLFEKQALVIVADNNRSSKDVRELAQEIQKKVFATIAIAIKPEVTIVQ